MQRGLAIETSGRIGSVAITEDGVVLAEDAFAHGLKHAAEMIPRLDGLLKNAGWHPGDIREIYVSIGPGSFTGIRIAVTVAKTLAFATGAKIVAVPTVDVLARNAPPGARELMIVLDAKRDQIFTARLRRAAEGVEWIVIESAHLDSLVNMLGRAPRPVYLLGDGIPYHVKFLPAGDSSIVVTPPELWHARAQAVAGIGHHSARAGQFTDPQLLSPLYLRKPEAEEKYEQQLAITQQNAVKT